MPTKRQLLIIVNYRLMMEEAKLRLECISAATSGIISVLPLPALREFCFLQLRMLCELIALGCLVAHGDIPATQTKRLQREGSPDRILAELEKLHPHFYPQPTRDVAPVGNEDRHFMPTEEDFLTKKELLGLYGACGNELHRGSIRHLLGRKPIKANHSDILEWRRKISALLRMHLIALLDGNTHLLCVLSASADKNRTHVAIAEAMEPPRPSTAT